MSNYSKNKKAALDETNPFGMPGEEAPSNADLMNAMLGLEPVESAPVISIPDNALVPLEDRQGAFTYKRFTITSTSLEIPQDVTQDEWFDVGHQLKHLDEALQWNIGDLIVYGQDRWELKYKDLSHKLGYEEQTLRAYVYVARNVASNIRINSLSHSHHRLVAGLRTKDNLADETLQREWLEKAAANNWTLSEMRDAMRADSQKDRKLVPVDVAHKKAFNRIWRRVQAGQPAKNTDIDQLRHWLDKLQAEAVD